MAVTKGHEDYLELAAIYALGALDDEDRSRFEAHLASGCRICQEALYDAERIAADLALAAPRFSPPDSLGEGLFARARRDLDAPVEQKPSSKRSHFLTWPMWLAAAASLAAVGLGLYNRTLQERVETEATARAELERELANLGQTLDAFTAPQTRAVSLAGRGQGQGAAAKAFIDPANRRLFLYVYNLPAPPQGRTYQLWLIVGGATVSMGTFGVQPDGSGRLDTATVPSFEGEVTVAVTVEPEGGVPQPTGPMVLVGS